MGTTPTIDQVRYGCFELKTECPHCGRPLILNGPARVPECDSCKNPVDLDGKWESLIGSFEEEYSGLKDGQGGGSTTWTGGFDLDINYWRLKPRCIECEKTLDVDEIVTGTDEEIRCPECGHETPTYPAQGWLKEAVPSAAQIFGAEREGEPTANGGDAVDPSKLRAIMVTCNNCGGSSRITHESARTINCSYCRADMVLPDPVWRRFHTPKVMKEWFVRFEGVTPQMQEREQRRAEERHREHTQKTKEANDEKRARLLLVPTWIAGCVAMVLWILWAVEVIGAWHAGAPDPWLTWQFFATAGATLVTNVLAVMLMRAHDEDEAFTHLAFVPMYIVPVIGLGIYVWMIYTLYRDSIGDLDSDMWPILGSLFALAPLIATSTLLLWFLRSLHFFF